VHFAEFHFNSGPQDRKDRAVCPFVIIMKESLQAVPCWSVWSVLLVCVGLSEEL
jgi:hypothetical protein